MTIDERLERLTDGLERLKERHDALTQTVEIMAHEIQGIVTAVREDSENIRALARIADMHDRRITRLEGGERQ